LHAPVLCTEVLNLLDPKPSDVVFDGTVGTGGHAEALLRRMGPSGRLLGCDLDAASLEIAKKRLTPFGDRVMLLHRRYDELPEILVEHPSFSLVNEALLDCGVSSPELEDSGRGFSFLALDEPLDMRYDPTRTTETAADILADEPEERLADLIRTNGEEPLARPIARAIARERERSPIRTVGELVRIVRSVYARRGYRRRSRMHPATRTFQAFRIAVNDELTVLASALPKILGALAPGGRMAVITFHSLEDHIVKQFFRAEARACVCPPNIPECRCTHAPRVRLLTKRPLIPSSEEANTNPRSRSAKLRACEKKLS
jgi:16S rRNA (cytosine1402-N4)-methyltransferase